MFVTIIRTIRNFAVIAVCMVFWMPPQLLADSPATAQPFAVEQAAVPSSAKPQSSATLLESPGVSYVSLGDLSILEIVGLGGLCVACLIVIVGRNRRLPSVLAGHDSPVVESMQVRRPTSEPWSEAATRLKNSKIAPASALRNKEEKRPDAA